MNRALDEVRAEESRHMHREGRMPVLRKSRWLLLKREENLADEQRFRLRDLFRYKLKTVRAYRLKEAFQQLWDYNSATWAAKFLDEWCRQTMRSRIEPMKKIARSRRQHRELILDLFSRTKADFRWRGGGSEQQGQSHHDKIVWIPYVPRARNGALPLTWQAA
jgi:transposase